MKNFQNDIDNLVSKILSEEIDSKVRKIMETNVEFDEELTGGQSKIDVAEPKGKITAADFKKLRDGKKSNKSEVEENIFKNMFGKKEDPEVAREKDRKENPSLWDAGYEYVNDIVGWQVPEPGQSRFRDQKDMEDKEMEEGNAFSGARAQAIEDGEDTFEVDGETYHVKGKKRMDESENKFIQNANMKKGGLHKALGIPEGNKIPKSKLNSIKKDLMLKAKGDKKLSAADSKLLKQVNMALTLGSLNESRNTLSLSENELIDMIEKIVKEQIVKDPSEKNNFSLNKPQGLKKTEKAQGESKKENDNYSKEVVKKMKDYMKDMYMGGKGYEANPDDFPQSNYDMEKEHKEMIQLDKFYHFFADVLKNNL